MPAPLEGLRIAVLETHRSREAAELVRRFGGLVRAVAGARDRVHPERVRLLIERLATGRVAAIVFMTGQGASILLDEAERVDRRPEVTRILRRIITVCRGPKPAAILRGYGVPVGVAVNAPYTTKQILEALDRVDLRGCAIALVPHGDLNSVLAAGLTSRGALPEAWPIYESAAPDDPAELQALVREIVDGAIDGIVFSNRSQCRHLLAAARDLGLAARVTDALNLNVVVAAVGPVCAEALDDLGIPADVIPARPTLESMIASLAEYFELTRDDAIE